MPGSKDEKKKKKKGATELKEKKATSSAKVKVDDGASGQQGLALSMATRVSYGKSMAGTPQHRTKAEIHDEFWARNELEKNATLAKHNEQCYRKYYQQ